MDTFATGLRMGESPRWHRDSLWVCDWMAGEVLRYDDAGAPTVVWRVDGFPFSIDWLPDGRAVLTSPTGVLVESATGLVPHGDPGARRPWNEIVVAPSGLVYVNEAGFDLMAGEPATSGTLAVVRPDGASRTVADDVWFPNGMAVLGDDTLICAESYAHRLTAFTIADDGSLVDRRVWAALEEDCFPDGICLDASGAAWYADVPRKRCVRVAEGGRVLEEVVVDRGAFACMLGGPDGRTLFVVANEWAGVDAAGEAASAGVVLSTRVEVPHAGRP